jgi:hypothetical protein
MAIKHTSPEWNLPRLQVLERKMFPNHFFRRYVVRPQASAKLPAFMNSYVPADLLKTSCETDNAD